MKTLLWTLALLGLVFGASANAQGAAEPRDDLSITELLKVLQGQGLVVDDELRRSLTEMERGGVTASQLLALAAASRVIPPPCIDGPKGDRDGGNPVVVFSVRAMSADQMPLVAESYIFVETFKDGVSIETLARPFTSTYNDVVLGKDLLETIKVTDTTWDTFDAVVWLMVQWDDPVLGKIVAPMCAEGRHLGLEKVVLGSYTWSASGELVVDITTTEPLITPTGAWVDHASESPHKATNVSSRLTVSWVNGNGLLLRAVADFPQAWDGKSGAVTFPTIKQADFSDSSGNTTLYLSASIWTQVKSAAGTTLTERLVLEHRSVDILEVPPGR